jgi:hypothetical protein
MKTTLYSRIANLLMSIDNCEKSGNTEWHVRHSDTLNALVKKHMPHGSGFDNGTHFAWEKSNSEKLVFETSFHHMNENGYYDGWSDHTITVKPSLTFGFNMTVSGKNRNEIKDYIGDVFYDALRTEVE